jgi:hypothetical protein
LTDRERETFSDIVRALRAEVERVKAERDHYKNKWLNSADNWRPGTYMNGA